MSRRSHAVLLFAVGLLAYGAVAGERLLRQSSDPHFVYQADAWLHGQLAIEEPPPARGDDWCRLQTVELRDGTTARGRYLVTRPGFQTTTGREIARSEISRPIATTHYVSFPPAPTLLMMPSALLGGRAGNDVIPTVLLAALMLPLLFACFERLRETGRSQRTVTENLWLTIAFAFGTVFYFSAVQGRVWYTAHVAGTTALIGYVLCSLDARRPFWAGLCLALATLSRAPMVFALPLFVLEAWRIHGSSGAGQGPLLRSAARFAAPLVVCAAAAMWFNAARFDDVLEFGHRYLAVRQQADIEVNGLFSLEYLARNLRVAGALVPELGGPHGIRINGHGLAVWLTTPAVVLLAWRPARGSLARTLWLCVAAVAAPALLYQNTGWFQFGYRFALDYLPLCFVLLAAGQAPLGRVAKALIAISVAVNLFGAITFSRYQRFYRWDAAAYKLSESRPAPGAEGPATAPMSLM